MKQNCEKNYNVGLPILLYLVKAYKTFRLQKVITVNLHTESDFFLCYYLCLKGFLTALGHFGGTSPKCGLITEM